MNVGPIMRLPTLPEISSYAFTVNLFLSNLMRIPVLGPILRIPVGILWLIGYGAWYTGSLIEGKPHPHQTDGWYTFAEFKLQNEISALIGTVATILLLVAPVLTIPIAWLFLLSNVFWALGAYNESNVLHTDDDDYSTDKQTIYSYLTFAVTALSFITAIGPTITLLFPLAAPVIFPLIIGIGLTLACISAGIAIKLYFGTYETDKAKRERQQTNTDVPVVSTGNELTPASQTTQTILSNPIQYNSPIHSRSDPTSPPLTTRLAI